MDPSFGFRHVTPSSSPIAHQSMQDEKSNLKVGASDPNRVMMTQKPTRVHDATRSLSRSAMVMVIMWPALLLCYRLNSCLCLIAPIFSLSPLSLCLSELVLCCSGFHLELVITDLTGITVSDIKARYSF